MKKCSKYILRFKGSNNAVSEVVGAILLLGIVISLFSVIYFVVLAYPFGTSPPTPVIIATVEGKNIVIEHRGGDELGLDTEIQIDTGTGPVDRTVGELLVDSNGDGHWNIGEKLLYPFNYSLSQTKANVTAVDIAGNRLVLTGDLDIRPECDIGVKCTVNNQYPKVGTNVIFTLTATHYRGDLVATDITIKFLLPPGSLQYVSNTPAPGTSYDITTGSWSIPSLNIGESKTLKVEAKVIGMEVLTHTQFALILDGSGSISSSDWNIMRNGLKAAIKNESCFPHDGSVELTVIQFGGEHLGSTHKSWAQLEIGPIIVNETNHDTLANNVGNLTQLQGYTPMAGAFNLAADIVSGDPNNYLTGTSWAGKASTNFYTFPRKVINLVTDGQANVVCNQGQYSGTYQSGGHGHPDPYVEGKASAENARNYLLTTLNMTTDNQDEFDSEAVGTDNDIPWLRDNIVYPQPGSDTWPPPGPGWVRHVTSYTEFADIIDEQFYIIFNTITVDMEILPSDIIDPNPSNNDFFITLSPHA
jgi:hypothetical protein